MDNTVAAHREVIFQFGRQTRRGKVDIDRTFCGPIGSIESGIVKSIIYQFQTKERHIYSHIATGGFWHEGQLSNIQLSSGQCKHCGATNVDHCHILWDCPMINIRRVNHDLDDYDHTSMPTAIKCGIPIAMSAQCNGNFWVEEHNTSVPSNSNAHETNRAISNDYLISQVIHNHQANPNNEQLCNSNARVVFQNIKGDLPEAFLATPWRCYVDAPDTINVYTDGSWLNPLKQ